MYNFRPIFMPDFTFHRSERLKSRKVIQQLFKGGRSFSHYPFRLVWLPMEERRSEAPVQFTVSVPRRQFRKATERNRIKRRVREAYRLNKHRLYRGLKEEESQIAFMVIYTGKEAFATEELKEKMQQLIRRFLKYK